MASEFAKGYKEDECSFEGPAEPISMTDWKDMTAEEKTNVIRLRTGGKVRCYSLDTIKQLYERNLLRDPISQIEWSPFQLAKIKQAIQPAEEPAKVKEAQEAGKKEKPTVKQYRRQRRWGEVLLDCKVVKHKFPNGYMRQEVCVGGLAQLPP